MQHDEVLQATLLLSCYFNKNEVKNIKPLTPTEYARFATWLHQKGLTPASLLHEQNTVLAEWEDPKKKITSERINSLFSRGASMGFALEHWAKHGIWVVSRASALYPQKIREKIGETRPAIFFGVGNQDLLNKSAIGFVGSRSVDTEDEDFTKTMAEQAVEQNYTVVSGGAKGIDQTAMLSALACGGECVGILSDSLLKASASKAYRDGLKTNKLALISPFYPEAGFNIGNAMARNKYIYAMSKSVVVVKTDFDKGGTWAGAVENLKKQWAPLLVRASSHKGNQELIKLGAGEIDEAFNDFNNLPITVTHKPMAVGDLFGSPSPEKQASEEPGLFDRFGPIFALFYKGLVESSLSQQAITLTELIEKYPELDDVTIKKWLKRLENESYLEQGGTSQAYKLTDKSPI